MFRAHLFAIATAWHLASTIHVFAFSMYIACDAKIPSCRPLIGPSVPQISSVGRPRISGSVASMEHGTDTRRVFLGHFALLPFLAPIVSAAASERTQRFETRSSELQLQDVLVGNGEEVVPGSRVTFHYIGRLAGRQGKPFEDTYLDEPVRVQLGKDYIIKGLEEGLLGMREGSKRRLLVPSDIGYQDRNVGPIPRSFGNRQRLYTTVLNKERTVREREALGSDIAGKVLMDVEVIRVRPPTDSK